MYLHLGGWGFSQKIELKHDHSFKECKFSKTWEPKKLFRYETQTQSQPHEGKNSSKLSTLRQILSRTKKMEQYFGENG